MSQHFLLSTAARSLSLAQVARLSDREARDMFCRIRWSENGGSPFCPHCGGFQIYSYACRPIYRCRQCGKQFSVTSGTIFASRKLPIRDYLLAIAIFCNGAKGHSALQLSRDLDCQYKTAFVLVHKLREAMAAEDAGEIVKGKVEIDGGHFGGYIKPANHIENRRDLRFRRNQNGKRQVVMVMREREGRTLTFVAGSEGASLPTLKSRIALGSTVYADEAPHWKALHSRYVTMRVNHRQAYSDNGACTNQAESFFSRLRRSEIGIHHHIAGPYLAAYAAEMDWREDHRRNANGQQYLSILTAALHHPVSRQWKGYWQRRAQS